MIIYLKAILSVSDLEQVSVKRIRGAIEILFATKFIDDDKKAINNIILERHDVFIEKETKEEENVNQLLSDAKFAKNLQKQESRTRGSSTFKKPSKKRKKDNNGGKRETAITTLKYNLTPKLSTFLDGETKLSRTEVVKRVWDYIKKNDLQNPEDRREILCDERMQPIFGKKVTMFSMNKVLSNHLIKDDEE
ncbi:hypothetical protein WICMUC_004168 [Wickerhamomyces mucosus]|uniref:DM2 domain-containing protein n=1 Tax=Wickerhamomyces mucosus TaxID=1378264 RepID=A0A9P8PK33_9ASCO|nr:hypothetical protein WICMUC_004168 [Wickerhamomyces mucosus]